jgi:ring-1,2-phenylacetyl-CoA epoxidase subunit PaaE
LAPLADVQETRFYICGPQAMTDSVEHDLLASGVNKKKIFRESFFSDNLAGPEKPTAHTPGAVFEEETGPFTVQIELDGKNYEVEVPVGETILQAALDQDIDMPYSCQSGLCTACRAKCHSGKIEMDETEGLVESEINEGYVLLCVGHPRSANIQVVVG